MLSASALSTKVLPDFATHAPLLVSLHLLTRLTRLLKVSV